jgi:anaerobic ribonucleoside-triphosphate reductase activating protein
MNYATIKKFDIANGVGVRVSLFVSGCRHHCKGCFNPEQWSFDYGTPFTDDTVEEIVSALDHDYITGLSLLGGEPMEPEQRDGLLSLLRAVKKRLPEKTVWCYSGFSFENDLLAGKVGDPEKLREMLSYIDVLVDGKFVDELKDPSLLFRGSSNQNIIDVKKSLAENRLVLLEGTWKRAMGSGDIHEN